MANIFDFLSKFKSSLKELGKTDHLTIWLPNKYFGNIWLESLEVQ